MNLATQKNPQRKYSIDEIDRMRFAVGRLHFSSGPYNPRNEAARLEDLLRTYMTNGTAPEELEAAAKKSWDDNPPIRLGTTVR